MLIKIFEKDTGKILRSIEDKLIEGIYVDERVKCIDAMSYVVMLDYAPNKEIEMARFDTEKEAQEYVDNWTESINNLRKEFYNEIDCRLYVTSWVDVKMKD